MGSNDVDRTLWCGNVGDNTTEELLYELFLQAGPLSNVKIATDKQTGKKKNFAFITFEHAESVPYTIELMNGIELFGRSLRLQSRPGSIHQQSPQERPSQQQQRNSNTPVGSPNIVPNTLRGMPLSLPPHLQQPREHSSGQFHRSMSAPVMNPHSLFQMNPMMMMPGQLGMGHGNQNMGSDVGRYSSSRYNSQDRNRDRSVDRSRDNRPYDRDHELKRQRLLQQQQIMMDAQRNRQAEWQQRRGRY